MKWAGLKIIIPMLLFAPVIWHNFFSINPITVGSDFRERTSWFDYLLPIGRTTGSDNGFVFRAEPVYFDLYLPVRLQNLRMVLKFSRPAQTCPIWARARNNAYSLTGLYVHIWTQN